MLHEVPEPVELGPDDQSGLLELQHVVVHIQVDLFRPEIIVIETFENTDSDRLGLPTRLEESVEVATDHG